MQLKLDGSGPLYRQLYRALRGAVLGGGLAPGARLPSTRALVASHPVYGGDYFLDVAVSSPAKIATLDPRLLPSPLIQRIEAAVGVLLQAVEESEVVLEAVRGVVAEEANAEAEACIEELRKLRSSVSRESLRGSTFASGSNITE